MGFGNGNFISIYPNTGGIKTQPVEKLNISICPNPATNTITIETPRLGIIEITNIQGQLIKTYTASNNRTNIDVSALPCGVYVIEVKTDKEIATRKFIKQ